MTSTTRSLQAGLATLVVALAMTGLAACSSASPNSAKAPPKNCKPKHSGVQTLKKGTLTVSTNASPPYSIKKGDSFNGVDDQILSKLAAMECLTLDEQAIAPAGLIANVQSKRADAGAGGIYYTAQRAESLSLTVPMYRDGMALLSKKGLSSLADLKGKKVGVIQGYLWNADLQKALGSGAVKLYQSSDGLMNDLKNGRVDAGVFTNAEASYRLAQPVGKGLQSETFVPAQQVQASIAKSNVVLALSKGNTSLTNALNADIKSLVAEGAVAKALSSNGMSASLAGGTPA